MSEALNDLASHIELRRQNEVISTQVAFGELTVTVTLAGLVDFVEFLRSDGNCRFSTLVDITAVDYPERAVRFDVVYHFLSMYQNARIRVRVAVREEDFVPSIIGVHPSANWFERIYVSDTYEHLLQECRPSQDKTYPRPGDWVP